MFFRMKSEVGKATDYFDPMDVKIKMKLLLKRSRKLKPHQEVLLVLLQLEEMK